MISAVAESLLNYIKTCISVSYCTGVKTFSEETEGGIKQKIIRKRRQIQTALKTID